jgi:hypothetical protein
MQINLPDDPNIQGLATAAGYASVEDYVFSLIERDTERMAIQQGLDAMQSGRTRPFEEFDAEFREKNDIGPEG